MTFFQLTLLTLLVACWCSGCQGQMMKMASPDIPLTLMCPEGQEINIMSIFESKMGFGQNIQDLCSSRPPTSCLSPLFLPWSKSICDNLQQCYLPGTDKRMFSCDDRGNTIISAIYLCENKYPDKRTVIACSGQRADLSCEKGSIRIVKSNYGRLDPNTCTDQPSNMTFCATADFEEATKNACNGRDFCSIPGNPVTANLPIFCDQLPKYVQVSYVCDESPVVPM